MIKINESWSIERHKHGGFNLIETTDSVGKKGQPINSKRSYYYPNLKLCSDKMIEQGFDNDAKALDLLAISMASYAALIHDQLERLIK